MRFVSHLPSFLLIFFNLPRLQPALPRLRPSVRKSRKTSTALGNVFHFHQMSFSYLHPKL